MRNHTILHLLSETRALEEVEFLVLLKLTCRRDHLSDSQVSPVKVLPRECLLARCERMRLKAGPELIDKPDGVLVDKSVGKKPTSHGGNPF